MPVPSASPKRSSRITTSDRSPQPQPQPQPPATLHNRSRYRSCACVITHSCPYWRSGGNASACSHKHGERSKPTQRRRQRPQQTPPQPPLEAAPTLCWRPLAVPQRPLARMRPAARRLRVEQRLRLAANFSWPSHCPRVASRGRPLSNPWTWAWARRAVRRPLLSSTTRLATPPSALPASRCSVTQTQPGYSTTRPHSSRLHAQSLSPSRRIPRRWRTFKACRPIASHPGCACEESRLPLRSPSEPTPRAAAAAATAPATAPRAAAT